MDFESPDVEKDFPGLYASETGKKSNESDFSDAGDHDKPSKKNLLMGKKDKKDKKDRGYATLAGESSPEEDLETKSPSKSKKTKSFKFPSTSKTKEKREKSRDKEKTLEREGTEKEGKEKKKEKDKKDKEKKDKHKEKEKEKEEKCKHKEKEKLKEKESHKLKEKEVHKLKEKEVHKLKEKESTKLKEKESTKLKDKDKKDKKITKIPATVTSGVPFEEIFTIGVALPIFGVTLQQSVDCMRCHDDTGLPLVFRECIDYLQENGLKSSQLYTTEPDKVKLQQLRKLYDDRLPHYPYHWDVPVACGLLKAYLSELTDGILGLELCYKFEQSMGTPEPMRRTAINGLIDQLPSVNRMLIAWLMLHFESVVANESINQINLPYLVKIMTPVLRTSPQLLTYLVTNAQTLFPAVHLHRYIPPMTAIPNEMEPDAISSELNKQESLLNQIHSEMHAGFTTTAREERLWETQRIVTQLKRMLRMAQKSSEPMTSSLHQHSLEMASSLHQHSLDEKQLAADSGAPQQTHSLPNLPPPKAVEIKEPKLQLSTEVKPAETQIKIDLQPDKQINETKDDIEDEFEDAFQVKDDSVKEITCKPKLSEQELELLRLRLENAEFLQLKSLLQAKINEERFEIVKLRSQIDIKSKLDAVNKEITSENGDSDEKQMLLMKNVALEQKRISLVNEIFQERCACIQLKIELAMKEIM